MTIGSKSRLFALRWNARRRSGGYAVDGDYELTDDAIRMRSGTETGSIAWEDVTGVAVTPEFWVLFVGRMPATVIPRGLLTADDAATLERFLADRGYLSA